MTGPGITLCTWTETVPDPSHPVATLQNRIPSWIC
jgi:hypothetical protein